MIVAAADLIAEQEHRRLSAASVITRAGVSPNEFYAAFVSLQDCLLAAFDEGLARLTETIARSVPPWATLLTRIDIGLNALLTFLDEEPGWGRVLLLELPQEAHARRLRALSKLAHKLSHISMGSLADPDLAPSQADATRLAADVLAIITENMRAREPLIALAPWLMSTVIEPRLAWPGEEREGHATSYAHHPDTHGAPILLAAPDPHTAHAVRVLRAIARSPRACNRHIAQASGVASGKISQQLRRLQEHGLIRNLIANGGRGRANAWVLTASGEAAVDGSAPEARQELRAAA